jgi:hypothetical protein
MVDDILKLLDKGSKYLDFPDDPSFKLPLPKPPVEVDKIPIEAPVSKSALSSKKNADQIEEASNEDDSSQQENEVIKDNPEEQ